MMQHSMQLLDKLYVIYCTCGQWKAEYQSAGNLRHAQSMFLLHLDYVKDGLK